MDIKVIRYSRDQLLKIQDTSQRTDNFNWSHIDSILHPPSKHKGNRIPTIIVIGFQIITRDSKDVN